MKRVLYHAASQSRDLARLLEQVPDCETLDCRENRHQLSVDGQTIDWVTESDPNHVLAHLKKEYVHLLVLDLRWSGDVSDFDEHLRRGLTLLDVLDDPDDLEVRYGFHRILVLVSGHDDERIDQLIAQLGRVGVGRVMRQRPVEASEAQRVAFGRRVLDEVLHQIAHRKAGKTALAASGGGITGIYFELGALKCLDDVLSVGVNRFDMYFGISAGAVVSGLLAVGFSVDEVMAAIADQDVGRIPPLDLALFRLGHVNLPDIKLRLRSGLARFLRFFSDLVGRHAPSLNSLFLDYTALVGPPFRSDRFEEMIRQIMSLEGASNDFRDLGRPLFIGASDQDARKHVIFGSEGLDHVPISKAIQGSLSVHPAFSSVLIDGRYYEDGAVTRTSDFVDAIDRGADLIFIIDPFVPYVSHEIGATGRRGILYNIDQDIRSLSYTRFENTRNWVLRKQPEISTYTFLPSNRTRELLSVNPMDHRPYLPIWRGAYISTFERIKHLCHRLRGDLVTHGIHLDLDRAAMVVSQLKSTRVPRFADFFPGREVLVRKPPLCC